MARIDLNADLGETVAGVPSADDEAMFAVISSASIACGGHAGDAGSMADAAARAARFGVAVGAHPSYPDPANFGRLPMVIRPDELATSIDAQLGALDAAGADIRYVKPHGALYHAVAADSAQARTLVKGTARLAYRVGHPVAVLGPGGELQHAADAAGIRLVREAFLDRGYRRDGSLVPRGAIGAVLSDAAVVAERAVRLAVAGTVDTIDGTTIAVSAASLCVHGDSPGAVAMARAVRAALEANGVEVSAPW